MQAIDKLLLFKFLKFCAVGLSGMAIDFGATWILKEKVKINRFYKAFPNYETIFVLYLKN